MKTQIIILSLLVQALSAVEVVDESRSILRDCLNIVKLTLKFDIQSVLMATVTTGRYL